MIAPATPHLWTANEAAAATAGRPFGDWRADGVSIDSRTLKPGDLFVAIKGPKHDGHEFVDEALKAGAAAVMIEPKRKKLKANVPALQVGDTTFALEDLGRAARARTTARIIAVTGSVGKTSTKESLRFVLETQGLTVANFGNLNNQLGVPLSLARMPADTAYGVFEIGMNHAGEIEPLSKMVVPRVAVITTVELVHSAHFDSIEQIADAKAEIFAGVDPDGAAVLNRDNPQFARLAAAAKDAGIGTVIGFGAETDAQVRLVAAKPESSGADIEADVMGQRISYRLNIPGRHWVMNSLGVLAAVQAIGADVKAAAEALAGMRAPKGRGHLHEVDLKNGPFKIIDESYNASPASMIAAIEVLGGMRPERGGRRIAVLGDMLELGADAALQHAQLAESLVHNKIDLVFAAGSHMKSLWVVLPSAMQGGMAEDSVKLLPKVTAAAGPGDIFVVKGSAGSNMRPIVEALLAMGVAHEAGSDECDWAVNG
jgi:UDP-N-acetylmuramoyl-tripeptide--D-alanyl-D-alanine ligase